MLFGKAEAVIEEQIALEEDLIGRGRTRSSDPAAARPWPCGLEKGLWGIGTLPIRSRRALLLKPLRVL